MTFHSGHWTGVEGRLSLLQIMGELLDSHAEVIGPKWPYFGFFKALGSLPPFPFSPFIILFFFIYICLLLYLFIYLFIYLLFLFLSFEGASSAGLVAGIGPNGPVFPDQHSPVWI